MTTLETLKAARAKIADPERWTQEVSARDATGGIVSSNSPAATCFCAQGVLELVTYGKGGFLPAWNALTSVIEDDDFAINPLVRFNDSHTHAEVLALFDKAIAEAQ